MNMPIVSRTINYSLTGRFFAVLDV